MLSTKNSVLVLIPSYCPHWDFPEMIQSLKDLGLKDILVINDGSPSKFDGLFQTIEEMGVKVLHSKLNLGKGAALQKGFKFIVQNLTEFNFVVCCDDDGQHHPKDVAKVSEITKEAYDGLILGSRTFSTNTPFKSFIGNLFMALFLYALSGKYLRDTQTGLRGFHRSQIPGLLSCQEQGYNFETISLLKFIQAGKPVVEVPIQTIYFNQNKSTRFRGLKDSWNVVWSTLSYKIVQLLK